MNMDTAVYSWLSYTYNMLVHWGLNTYTTAESCPWQMHYLQSPELAENYSFFENFLKTSLRTNE